MSGQVARLTQWELADLDNHSFFDSYRRYNKELVDLAKASYMSICIALNAPPTEVAFHAAYTSVLLSTELYIEKIAKKKNYLQPPSYGRYAELLAKYVREHDWVTISGVPCPP